MEVYQKNRFGQIKKVLTITLFLNWTVSIAKILYGLYSKSSSITADGFHSLSDGASNILGLIGISLASQPKDKDHPYGHKKYETFFSLGIAALLFLLSFNLIRQGITRIFNPIIPSIDFKSFIVMIITLAVNFVVVIYEKKKGKELQSDFLVFDAMHTKADIFISSSVIIALIFIKSGYPILDPVVTIIISFFIAYSGYEIIRDGSRILCDTAVIVDIKQISDIVLNIKGVKTCHDIRTRGREDDIYVDLHVQVDSKMHMDKAHSISDTIEEAVKKGIPGVTDVIVHMEPE